MSCSHFRGLGCTQAVSSASGFWGGTAGVPEEQHSLRQTAVVRNNEPSHFIALSHSQSTFTFFNLINPHNGPVNWMSLHTGYRWWDWSQKRESALLSHGCWITEPSRRPRGSSFRPNALPTVHISCHIPSIALMKQVFYSHWQMAELKLELIGPKSHSY